MTASDVLAILDRLDAAGIAWWVDGGWGVDALLGEQTRPHHDLDFAVREQDVPRLGAILPEFREIDLHQRPSAYVLRDAQGRTARGLSQNVAKCRTRKKNLAHEAVGVAGLPIRQEG